jgi:hypothetical protein
VCLVCLVCVSGLILVDTIRELLSHWSFVPNGLKAVGYDSTHLGE